MEIGKVEKVDLKSISVRLTSASPLRTRIEGLEVGQAFTVEGVDRSQLSFVTQRLNKEGRRLAVHKLALGVFRVVRFK